jgi:hypothetical protein
MWHGYKAELGIRDYVSVSSTSIRGEAGLTDTDTLA